MNRLSVWSGGARVPLTYNLKAGQFRSNPMNIFSQTNYIMSYGGWGLRNGAPSECDCDQGSSTPKIFQWLMGGGMAMSFLGNIMSLFGGSKKQVQQAENQVKVQQEQQQAAADLKNIQDLYPDYTIRQFSNGTFVAKAKDGSVITAKTQDELLKALQDANTPKKDEVEKKEKEVETPKTPTVDKNAEELYKTLGITLQDGKYIYEGTAYDTLSEASQARDKALEAAASKKALASSSSSGSTGGGKSITEWYRASQDYQSIVRNLTTEAEIKKMQEEDNKDDSSAAQYVLSKVLQTKLTNYLNSNTKIALIGEIVSMNPSVFNQDGTLKKNADLSKLDVPTKDYIEKRYRIKITEKRADGSNVPEQQQEIHGCKGLIDI